MFILQHNNQYFMKSKTIKPKYLACIWCGGDIPKDKPYAQYCSPKCKDEALGFNQ